MLSGTGNKRLLLSLSLLLNLGVLAFFKYFNFFSAPLAERLASLGWHADPLLLGLALPAGLSFYTLKKLSYMIDLSRRTVQPARGLAGFCTVCFLLPADHSRSH